MSDKPVNVDVERKRLGAGVIKIYKATTFLAHMLLQRPILVVETTEFQRRFEHDTACTDGQTIWFDATFASKKPQEELNYVLIHEGMHIALMHTAQNMDLAIKRGRENVDWNLLNYCRDAYINYYADEIVKKSDNEIKSPSDRITIEKILEDFPDAPPDFITRMTAIELHDMLKPQAQKQSNWKNRTLMVQLVGGTPQPGQSAEEQLKVHMQDLKSIILGAQIQSGHKRLKGENPLGYEEVVNRLLEPTPSLEGFLRTYIQQGPGLRADYSRPARTRAWMCGPNQPILPRYRNRATRRVVLALDSSGSMSKSDMAHAVDICYELLRESRKSHVSTELHIWTCDTEVHVIDVIKTYDPIPEELNIVGRGGTSFKPVLDKFEDQLRNGWDPRETNLVYVTDSFGDAQNLKEPGVKPVWVIPPHVNSPQVISLLPWGAILTLSHQETRIIRDS